MKSKYMTWILFEAIDAIIAKGVLDNKKIVLFGLNAPAFACKQYLQDKGYEIYAYVDNNGAAVGLFNDRTVEPTFHHMIGSRRIEAYSPGGLPNEYRDEYVFLLYSKYEGEMLAQLASMGYEQGVQAFVMGGFWKTEEIMKSYVPEGAGAVLDWDKEKKHQIEAVKYIQRLCDRHGLRVYIHYGTLIGAVRHNGYIPWDDDMDLCMPTRDLNKLIDIIHEENGRYDVYYAACSKPCRHFIAKIEDKSTLMHQWDIPIELVGGLIVDIFPLGGMPGDYNEAMEFYKEVTRLSWEYDNLVVEFPNASEEIDRRREELKNKILDYLAMYPFEESEYVFTVPDKPGSNRVYPRRIWDERAPFRFEGEIFYGPAGYDEFLRIHYGGYMELPPENRRVSIHRNKVFALANVTENELEDAKNDSSKRKNDSYEQINVSRVHGNIPLNENGKKTLLYYISLSDFWAYGERAVLKLKSSLATMANAQELNIVLLSEESLEPLLSEDKPSIYKEYISSINDFVNENQSRVVRIPLGQQERATTICDAFYGAPGEIMWEFMNSSKPVMVRSVDCR